eukprot:TRINITY_DN14650_c0_g1_i2.p1 TRINITY_DN14650_c0_g1~~TRINITY_DN14650_c0_g1_i2.p1  ORF type:complete len:170 (+),score=30.28 TRINITY_DN14650_c0_g1_i2:183-692(+)
MLEQGSDSKEFLQFVAEDSHNFDDSGFFNVTVLSEAFRFWSVECEPIESHPEAQQDPTSQAGFICNLKNHWLGIRPVNGVWFNFDSMKKRPEILSEFYLCTFIFEIQNMGYTVYVIHGNLPEPGMIEPQGSSENWHFFPKSDTAKKEIKVKQKTEDEEIEEAIKLSLGK